MDIIGIRFLKEISNSMAMHLSIFLASKSNNDNNNMTRRSSMAIRFVEFSSGGTKLEGFLHKNQRTQRKLLNFENGTNGKVSKIEHHFINKVI